MIVISRFLRNNFVTQINVTQKTKALEVCQPELVIQLNLKLNTLVIQWKVLTASAGGHTHGGLSGHAESLDPAIARLRQAGFIVGVLWWRGRCSNTKVSNVRIFNVAYVCLTCSKHLSILLRIHKWDVAMIRTILNQASTLKMFLQATINVVLPCSYVHWLLYRDRWRFTASDGDLLPTYSLFLTFVFEMLQCLL